MVLIRMRRGASTPLARIMIGIMAIAMLLLFALEGNYDAFLQGGEEKIYKGKGISVSKTQFTETLNKIIPQFGSILGADAFSSVDAFKKSGILNFVQTSLVNRPALEKAAEDAGYQVSYQTAEEHIKNDPEFMTDGKFSVESFQAKAQEQEKSPTQYINDHRRVLALNMLLGNNLPVQEDYLPKFIENILVSKANEKRAVDYFVIKKDAIKIDEPSEQEIIALYDKEKSKSDNQVPEMRKLSFLVLNSQSVDKKIKLTEEEIKKSFESRKAEFEKKEKRSISQITFSTEDEATAFKNKASGVKDLAKLAKDEKKSLVKLEDQTKDSAAKSYVDKLFAAKVGDVIGPVKTDFGFGLIWLDKIVPEEVADLAKSRPVIETDLKKKKAKDLIPGLATKMDDLVAARKPLDFIAKELDINLERVDLISAQGKNVWGGSWPNIPQEKSFLVEAFKLKKGDISTLITLKDGQAIVHIEDIFAPRAKRLDEIKPMLIGQVKNEKEQKALDAKAKSLTEEFKSGKSLEVLAKAMQTKLQVIKAQTQQAYLREQGEIKLTSNKIFAATKDQILVAPTNDSYIVAHVTDIVPPAKDLAYDKLSEEEKPLYMAPEEIKNRYAKPLKDDLTNALASEIISQAKVKTDEEVLDKTIKEVLAKQDSSNFATSNIQATGN